MKLKLNFFILICFVLINFLNTNEHENFQSSASGGLNFFRKLPSISNLSTTIGETVYFNCSLLNERASFFQPKFPLGQNELGLDDLKLSPTWLKADPVYSQTGSIAGFKTENIIVTRKGIIADNYRDKMKLIKINEQSQTLRVSNVNIRNEGKYICREFNSQYDKLFYLNVYAGVNGLNIRFSSPSKYFRAVYTGVTSTDTEDSEQNASGKGINFSNSLTSSISIRENDELTVNCTVNSSKPAANISMWLVPNHRTTNEDETRKLDIYEFQTFRNKDLTLKSLAMARFVVSRADNQKSVICIAENAALDEKWESKRILNVLYAPKCSKYQKTIYNTGINQSVELECRMTDANPPYLDFTWHFANNQGNKDRTRSNGFVSRINWTPRHESDFGEISCVASNGLDTGECKIQLQLGGAPNPPHDCYHKENNKTIIIECKPGFDQGDPEVYFYLLKKKSNGVLVEYARKRDSCSFLISNLILEEHLNDFYVYSSNKYGNNKEHATRIVIENKEFLNRESNKLQESGIKNSKRLTLIVGAVCVLGLCVCFICCLMTRCRKDENNGKKYTQGSHKNLQFHQDPYKYNSHYSSKSSLHVEPNYALKKANDEKLNYLSSYGSSSSEFEQQDSSSGIYDNKKKIHAKMANKSVRSPSLINNLQDLEMSPKSKLRSLEKAKEANLCSHSLIDETTETEDSENYLEYNNRAKLKSPDQTSEQQSISTDDQKNDFYDTHATKNANANSTSNNKKSLNNGVIYSLTKMTMPKMNVWYSNHGEVSDDYTGISVDKSTSSLSKKPNSYSTYLNGNLVSEHENERFEEEKRGFSWSRNHTQVFSNETISLDVDDEKVVGILV